MLLFLDFDGVLHPFFPSADLTDEENQHFSYLPCFEDAIRTSPLFEQIEIVISSTWRLNRSIEEIKAFFSPDIAQKILGGTPQVTKEDGADGARLIEVEAWLEQNKREHEDWIGIDDNVYLYAQPACVVKCMDRFKETEYTNLQEALKDPHLWAEKHPVPLVRENLIKPRLLTKGMMR